MGKRQFVRKLAFLYFCCMQKRRIPKRQSTQRFYEAIRTEYRRLSEVTEYGKPKYSYERILAELSVRFFREEKTIENIIFNRV